MNPQRVLKIDRRLGKPICWALTLVRRIAARFAPGRAPSPLHKILFIKMIEQGATVLACAAIARAVEMVGRENVYFLVFKENRPILDLLGLVPPQNVIELDTSNGLPRLMWAMIGALRHIRRLGIDATVDMEFFARAPAIIAFLSGAPRRVGLHRFTSEGPYRGDLLTHRVQHNPHLHTADAYLLLVEALTENPHQVPLSKRPVPARNASPPLFAAQEQELEQMRRILRQELGGEPPGRIVLLNANASDLLPLRKWPTQRFVELARRLIAQREDLAIVLTGGPSERSAAETFLSQIASPRAVSLAGKTTLRQLLVLFSLADVLVTNDSGPGHFASMTPIDAVVLFGPETPLLYAPLGPRIHIQYAQLACSPCVNALNHRFSPCTDNVCMQVIEVREVFKQVVVLLKNRDNAAVCPTLQVLETTS